MLELSTNFESVNGLAIAEGFETVEAVEVKNQFSFEVVEQPIFLTGGVQVPNHKAIIRNDNGLVLNVCKESYTPVTNEMFCEFVFNVQKITGFDLVGFNEFDNGKKVLGFLKAPETALNGWSFNNFMVIGNAHDSTKAFFIANTSIMHRCQNQFSMFSNKGLKAQHSTGIATNLKYIENSIHLYGEQQKMINANFENLLHRSCDAFRTEQFVKHVLDLENIDFNNEKSIENISTRKLNQLDELMNCIETEINDMGKNDFALFSGVTRYTSHVRTQKNKSFGNLFGTNADLNNKALGFLLN